MKISKSGHLTYCTNIHPGETWPEVFNSLTNATEVRDKMNIDEPFGIGLRLSAQAANQLGLGEEFDKFRGWLSDSKCYVFTMNGFPYGGFHNTVVKDQVHAPDWTTKERLDYTKLLFDQLAILLPEGLDGGISTSPISYRFWHKSSEALEKATNEATLNMLHVVMHVAKIKARTGKVLHLDIEPEPDGVLENSAEFIDFFENVLLLKGRIFLSQKLKCDFTRAEELIREHVRLCYDVCHFAVGYEEPNEVLNKMNEKGIKIGKIQISAAIKTLLNQSGDSNLLIRQSLEPYNESTYLHQTVFRKTDGSIAQYPDLGPALAAMDNPDFLELRTHFHVPIFTDTYGHLQSTQDEIVKVLNLWKNEAFSQHLEVETYTWDVLPDNNQLELTDSIYRELDWVVGILEK